MNIYVVIWVILLIGIWIHDSRLSFIIKSIVYISLLIIYSFRGIDVGVDTSTYHDIFDSISKVGYLPYLEPLWNLLNIFTIEIGGNFNLLLCYAGILTITPIFIVANRFSSNSRLSLYIYYSMFIFCGAMNLARQYLGLSFILLAFCYFKKNKWVSLVSLVIAVGFHVSSIFILFLLPFLQVKNLSVKKNISILAISFFIGSFLIGPLTNIVFSFGYAGYEEDLYREGNEAYIFIILMNVFYSFIFIASTKEQLNSDIGKWFLLSAIVLNIVFQLGYGTRIYNIFAISNILYCPIVLESNKVKSHYFVSAFIYFFFAICFFRMIMANSNEVLPYKFTIY